MMTDKIEELEKLKFIRERLIEKSCHCRKDYRCVRCLDLSAVHNKIELVEKGIEIGKNKCAFSKCNNKAETIVSNNLNDDGIGFCKSCLEKYETHLNARALQLGVDKGKQDRTEEELKFLGKLDNIWAEQEDKKGENVELNKIHRMICNRYNKLKSKLKEMRK